MRSIRDSTSKRGLGETQAERPLHPRHRHTHGQTRPCSIRCGANEGICVRNNQTNVLYLFTDGLVNCTQVIFRSATATFTCHIFGAARHPVGFIKWAMDAFIKDYGAITSCWVVTGDSVGAGDEICGALRSEGLAVTRILGCGGYAIRISDGAVQKTPSGWNAGRADVAGTQTASGELIDLIMTSRRVYLGEVTPGDFWDSCRECDGY
jgi:hypothetical protein